MESNSNWGNLKSHPDSISIMYLFRSSAVTTTGRRCGLWPDDPIILSIAYGVLGDLNKYLMWDNIILFRSKTITITYI